MKDETKSELAAVCDELGPEIGRRTYHGVADGKLALLIAAARRADKAERERDDLQLELDNYRVVLTTEALRDAGEPMALRTRMKQARLREALAVSRRDENARAAALIREHGQTIRESLITSVGEALNDEWILKANAAAAALAEVMKNG